MTFKDCLGEKFTEFLKSLGINIIDCRSGDEGSEICETEDEPKKGI